MFVVFRPGTAVDPSRIISVTRNGQPVLDTAMKPETPARPADNNAHIVNTFTMAVWVKPEADTELPPEANSGIVGMTDRRNDALYPPPGHEVYAKTGHAGSGLAVGRNGVCVFEHAAYLFAPLLVAAAPLSDWTHVAVVYRGGQPSLYLNGKLVRKGLKSRLKVHPGTGCLTAYAPPFRGELGDFVTFDRALSEAEIASLLRSTPRPLSRSAIDSIALVRRAAGSKPTCGSRGSTPSNSPAARRGRSLSHSFLRRWSWPGRGT